MVRTARGEGESMRAGTQADKQEVTKLIQHCLSLQQGTEFGRQIKRLFSHHSLWLASAAIIVLVGIPLDLPVVAVSAAVFMSMFFFNKIRFTKFWRRVVPHFDRKAEDLADVITYYSHNDRKILVMTVAGMVGGVVCLKETESVEDKKTCQVSRIFVHPDCRRMGVASKLFQGAKIEALKLGYKILSVETFETNVEMIEFCNKKNFGHSSSKLVAEVYPLTFSVVHFQMDLVKSKVFS